VIVWTGTQMIGWGGGCCGDVYADGAAYTSATNTWKKLPAAPLSGRHAMGAWTGTEMLVFGGDADDPDNGRTGVFADGAAYNPVTRTWRKLPSMPVARSSAQAVWNGTEVLIVGGSGKGPAFRNIPRGVAYNPSTNTWRWLSSMEFPRTGHVAVWTGSRLLVWGGMTDTGTPPRGEAYDPTTNAWSALPKAPLRGRSGAIAVWTGVRMIVWGGKTDQGVRLDGAWYRPA
jgi:N-acetylneuraminic acid mutarotase